MGPVINNIGELLHTLESSVVINTITNAFVEILSTPFLYYLATHTEYLIEIKKCIPRLMRLGLLDLCVS